MTEAERVAAFDEMEAWCKRQAEANTLAFGKAFWGGANVNSAPMRHLHGQGYAYGRMRSYIAGAKRAILEAGGSHDG